LATKKASQTNRSRRTTMFKTMKIAIFSALIGLGGLAAVPATAQADGLYLNFSGGNGGFGVHAGDHRGRSDWRRNDRNWRHDNRDWRRGCSPQRALNKAERMGLRRARIVDASPRTVKVAGRKFNHRQVVVFANRAGCPIVYR
jgi:hypothetical protein